MDELSTALLRHPLWRAEDLGKPIPDSPHAASVAMPLWEHVVRYEEGDPELIHSLQGGYPRFVFNAHVTQLVQLCRQRFARDGEWCLVFPSERVAARGAEFIRTKTHAPVRIEPYGLNGVHVLVFPATSLDAAKKFWQHYGEIVSSRQALATLDGQHESSSGREAKLELRARIAKLAGVTPNEVWLYPTGMAALAGALRAAQQRTPKAGSIQVGLPYVDLLRIQTQFGPEGRFYPLLNEETFEAVQWVLSSEPVSAVFCEIPGNPLLQTVDLERLSAMCRAHRVPLVADETLGSFLNVDVTPYADLIATSLTKYFSGVGDVMGGSLIFTPNSPLREELERAHAATHEDILWWEDAVTLEHNSRDFVDRMRRINANAEALAEFLRGHRRIERVYFPKYETPANYAKARRNGAAYGGLFSIVLKDGDRTAPTVYDRLRVSKGPSLGTNYSLACPYTLLAHYSELDWVESIGVSRFLIRVSIGLEDVDDLKERFKDGLKSA